MTHIIRHPLLQNHNRLARAYSRMANALSSKGTDENVSAGVSTLRAMAEEHKRKAMIKGRKGSTFIFKK